MVEKNIRERHFYSGEHIRYSRLLTYAPIVVELMQQVKHDASVVRHYASEGDDYAGDSRGQRWR